MFHLVVNRWCFRRLNNCSSILLSNLMQKNLWPKSPLSCLSNNTKNKVIMQFIVHVSRQYSTSFFKQQEESSKATRPEIDASIESTSSLHSNIHYLLSHNIQIGRMNQTNLQNARSFLSIASKWHNEQGATLSEALLERIYQEKSTGKNCDATVDAEMYNICMSAWNASGIDGTVIAKKVENIISRMEERYRNAGYKAFSSFSRPDRISYNCLINAYSKSNEDSDHKVEATLDTMLRLAQEAKSSSELEENKFAQQIYPDELTYNSIMTYYASRQSKNGVKRAQKILLRMWDLSQQDQSNLNISSISFNIVLSAWSNCKAGIEGAKMAKSLLNTMIRLSDKGYQNIEPTAISFSIVIDAFSKIDPKDGISAVDNVMVLLDILEGRAIPDPENINSCYNAAANVIARSRIKNAGDAVVQLMKRMNNLDAVPDENIYVSCMNAYVKEGKYNSCEKARDVLMIISEDLGCNPSSVAFNILLSGLAKIDRKRKTFEMLEDLMKQMEMTGGNSRPDLTSYNIMITFLSKSGFEDSAMKAVGYLRSMLRSYNIDGYIKAKPSSYAYNCVISMLARCEEDWVDDTIYKTLMSMENQQKSGNTEVIPDTITYNTVIGKLAKKPSKENAKKVVKILAHMENMERAGTRSAAPDIITYTDAVRIQQSLDQDRAAEIAVRFLERGLLKGEIDPIDRFGLRTLLLALSRSNKIEHAMAARKAWDRIECSGKFAHILDSEMCNLVLFALSKIKTKESIDEVESFLIPRINERKNDDKATVLPTIAGISAALTSFSNDGRINDALSLLTTIRELSEKDPMLKPDKVCYISILSPLSKNQSWNKNNAIYVHMVWKMIKEDFYVPPNALVNAAINACAWSHGDPPVKQKAIETAIRIFEEAIETKSLNAVTYGVIIKACMKLSLCDEIRFNRVKPLFEHCAKNGLVGNMVLREIKELKLRLIPDGKVPLEWTTNAIDV